MTLKIDLKSILCGLIIGVATMLVIGADSEPPRPEIGRYQIVATGTYATIVDSVTGRAWSAAFLNTAQLRNDPDFWPAKK